MRILLLGEFSGFFSNLKDGLVILGHEVVLASYCDGYKKIESADISFEPKCSGIYGKIENRIRPLISLPKLSGFDVVQLINPFVFDFWGFPKKRFLQRIKCQNRKFFLSACGSDAYYWQKGRTKLRYGPFEDTLKYDFMSHKCKFQTRQALRFNKSVVDLADGVIPVMFDYECGYSEEGNLKPTIPLPLNTNKIAYMENTVSDKLVIFHGLSRYGFKGTHYVEKAFDILDARYPGKLELIIEGKIALKEYLSIMKKSNIVIDQTNTYSAGMNALFAMAQGKVALSGAEPKSFYSLGVSSSPVINIKPDPQHIVGKIEKLIDNAPLIKKIGAESRAFVVRNHNHVEIAKKYIALWSR